MRNLLLLCSLYSAAALAKPESFHEEQLLTRAAPTLSTEGLSLIADSGYPVRGFVVSVCAEDGETLSAAGTLRAWAYHPEAAVWMRNPDLDLDVSVSGTRCQVFPDLRTGLLMSRRVLFAADELEVSGGTTVAVRIDGDTNL